MDNLDTTENGKTLSKEILLAVLSSAILVLSFPKFNLGFLAWIGLIPLLLAIHGENIRRSFCLSQLTGMLFFMGIFRWILVIPGYTIFHHALLALYLGSYFGCFGLLFGFLSRRWGRTQAMFAAPFIWTALEFLRSNFSFLALPWCLLAHSQFQYPVIIQITSVAGTYSISFLIVLVNSAIAALLLGTRSRAFSLTYEEERTTISARETITLVSIAFLSFVSTVTYGYFVLPDRIEGNRVKISMVQGNVEQFKKWDPFFALEIRKIYMDLTKKVSNDQPKLVIWPETATPGSITTDPIFYRQLIDMTKRTGIPLLLGSAHNQKLSRSKERNRDSYNSAFLLGGNSPRRIQRYYKMQLFPFGEYTPYKEIIPWSLINVPVRGNYIPGKEYRIFEHPDFRFGVTICWENVFTELVREFVKSGAECIVNLTNEAHFGNTAAPHQLLAISVFRAVENRVFVVRCANTGVSCIIDPYGRIVDRVKDDKGRDTFIRGTLTGCIVPMQSKTLFTEYGNVLAWICVFGSMGFLFTAVLKRKR